MITSIDILQTKGFHKGKEYDIDQYTIHIKFPLSSQEFTISIDHAAKEINGETIRYGSWGELSESEIKEYLALLEAEGKIKRSFQGYKIIE